MIKIRVPKPPIQYNLDGIVLLEYTGPNHELWVWKKCSRKGQFLIDLQEYYNSTDKYLCFQIEFEEFWRIKLLMDFESGIIEKEDQELGTVEMTGICMDNSCLIISGRLYPGPISLAYHFNDIIDFDAIFDISNLDLDRFKKDIDKLQNTFPELNIGIISNYY